MRLLDLDVLRRVAKEFDFECFCPGRFFELKTGRGAASDKFKLKLSTTHQSWPPDRLVGSIFLDNFPGLCIKQDPHIDSEPIDTPFSSTATPNLQLKFLRRLSGFLER